VLYLGTFASTPALASADLVGDADSGQYTGLLTTWDIGRRYGDAFRAADRQLGDRQQSHKIKHILFLQLFGPVVRGAVAAGADPWMAAKAPTALLAAITVALVAVLLARANVNSAVVIPAQALLALAPGMWTYAAQPDSWVLTGTLVLALVLWCVDRPTDVLWQGAAIGVAMLNNVFVGSVCVVVPVLRLCRGGTLAAALRGAVLAGVIALAAWTASLVVLSRVEPDLSPRTVLAQLQFTRQLVPPLPHALWHPTTIRLSLEQWTLTAFTSYQHDRELVGWGLGSTWETSWVGRTAILAMVATWAWALVAVAWDLHARRTGYWHDHALLCAVVAVTAGLALLLHVGNPHGVLLYSPLMAPLAVLMIAMAIGRSTRRGSLLWGTAVAVAMAAICQISWLHGILNRT
jgi:hypothetical protein